MIDLDLSLSSEDRRVTVAAFINGVLSELCESSRRSCVVRVDFGVTGAAQARTQKFRITYLGPSRRQARRPSMTGNRSK